MKSVTSIAVLILMCFSWGSGFAENGKAGLIYVPVYSHVFAGPAGKPLELTITLSVRNIDDKSNLVLESVNYYDSDGKLVRKYLDQPRKVPALASTHFTVAELDTTGGFGAKFLVRWKGENSMNVPLVQAVMVTTRSGQGVSFITDGRTIDQTGN